MKKTGKGCVRLPYYDIIDKVCHCRVCHGQSFTTLYLKIIIIGQRKSVCPSVLVNSMEENNGSFVGDRHPYRIGSSSGSSSAILHLCLLLNHPGY